MKCKPRIKQFQPKIFGVGVHNVHFMVCAPIDLSILKFFFVKRSLLRTLSLLNGLTGAF